MPSFEPRAAMPRVSPPTGKQSFTLMSAFKKIEWRVWVENASSVLSGTDVRNRTPDFSTEMVERRQCEVELSLK